MGWKGLINDPYMNDTFKIEDGLHIARRLLIDLAEMAYPCPPKRRPHFPSTFRDLISWSAIGARTTESQTHREMASGLSSAVGFLKRHGWRLNRVTNALMSVQNPHRFLGINADGQVSIVSTEATTTAIWYCVAVAASPTTTQ